MKAKGAHRDGGSATLAKGIGVLHVLAHAGLPPRFGDLAAATGLPKATLHRMLRTLIAEGLVQLRDEDQTYHLGLRLFEMAHRVWQDLDLRGSAMSEMLRLRAETGEAVGLGMLSNGDVVYVDELDGLQPVRIGRRTGRRDPAYCTAIGKALLAQLGPEELDGRLATLELRPHSARTITDVARLRAELDLVTARGYALEQDEHEEGVCAVAAAIIDHRDRAVAALGLHGPAFRLDETRLHTVAPALIEAVRRLSLAAGGQPRPVATGTPPAAAAEGLRPLPGEPALLGEFPAWCPRTGRLWWVDVLAPALRCSDLVGGEERVLPMDELVGGLALAQRDYLVLATRSGFVIYDPAARRVVRRLGHPEASDRGNRYNGGRCDRLGRLWAGSMSVSQRRNRGRLYRVCGDGTVDCVLESISQANGIAWSPDDRRIYVVDMLKRAVFIHDFDLAAGALGERRLFVRLGEESGGQPTGIAVDAQGYLWCAIWDGWRLQRHAPDGRLERVIRLPVPRPTSLAFGGPDLRTLLITTARVRVAPETLAHAPLSGRVLAMEVDTAGLPPPSFVW